MNSPIRRYGVTVKVPAPTRMPPGHLGVGIHEKLNWVASTEPKPEAGSGAQHYDQKRVAIGLSVGCITGSGFLATYRRCRAGRNHEPPGNSKQPERKR